MTGGFIGLPVPVVPGKWRELAIGTTLQQRRGDGIDLSLPFRRLLGCRNAPRTDELSDDGGDPGELVGAHRVLPRQLRPIRCRNLAWPNPTSDSVLPVTQAGPRIDAGNERPAAADWQFLYVVYPNTP